MSVLAIETSSVNIGVALVAAEGTLSAFVARGARRHVELLLPAITSVLNAAGVRAVELEGIVVDTGPGLFTGLRAGVAAAKGLAMGSGVVALGCSSTAVLRAGVELFSGEVVAALDVRRGEVAFEFPGDSGASIAPMTVVLERLDDLASKTDVLLVGNGWNATREEIAERYQGSVRLVSGDFEHPSASVLGALGYKMVLDGVGGDAAALEVNYLREADAAITWTTRSTEGV